MGMTIRPDGQVEAISDIKTFVEANPLQKHGGKDSDSANIPGYIRVKEYDEDFKASATDPEQRLVGGLPIIDKDDEDHRKKRYVYMGAEVTDNNEGKIKVIGPIVDDGADVITKPDGTKLKVQHQVNGPPLVTIDGTDTEVPVIKMRDPKTNKEIFVVDDEHKLPRKRVTNCFLRDHDGTDDNLPGNYQDLQAVSDRKMRDQKKENRRLRQRGTIQNDGIDPEKDPRFQPRLRVVEEVPVSAFERVFCSEQRLLWQFRICEGEWC